LNYESSIKDVYNGLVSKYQFEHSFISEGQEVENVHYFCCNKVNHDIASKFEFLGHIANDLCQPELADKILITADELSSDGVPPMPM